MFLFISSKHILRISQKISPIILRLYFLQKFVFSLCFSAAVLELNYCKYSATNEFYSVVKLMIVVSLTEMKVSETSELQPEDTQHEDNGKFDASDVLNSTEVAGDNQNMFGYIQDNFEFLDQMDCSGMDHMDCSVSYQVCFLWLQIFLST